MLCNKHLQGKMACGMKFSHRGLRGLEPIIYDHHNFITNAIRYLDVSAASVNHSTVQANQIYLLTILIDNKGNQTWRQHGVDRVYE